MLNNTKIKLISLIFSSFYFFECTKTTIQNDILTHDQNQIINDVDVVSLGLKLDVIDNLHETNNNINLDLNGNINRDLQSQPCLEGTRLVEGEYCPEVQQTCLRWADDFSGTQQELRCLEFAPSRCLSRQRIHMRFCMDIYEAPNRRGVDPVVMVSWHQAQQACTSQGKRLCTSNEWEFACEGPDINPYPYGLIRDSTACRIDHQTIRYNPQRLANPLTRDDEVRRVYEAVPSGTFDRCVSWSGIHDMTGNVDEWVVNSHSINMDHAPYRSGLKGGWWANVRARCRPMTTVHGPSFVYYQISYRCCQDSR